MYEFIFGVFVGVWGSIIARARKKTREIGVQIEAVQQVPTQPVIIKRRVFVPGQLKNFWGPDSQ